MTDDPRQVLKAAGVECAEVESWEKLANARMTHKRMLSVPHVGDAAILALARLAADGARYKWQRGKLTERLLAGELKRISACGLTPQYEQDAIAEAYRWKDAICGALEDEWAEEHDA